MCYYGAVCESGAGGDYLGVIQGFLGKLVYNVVLSCILTMGVIKNE